MKKKNYTNPRVILSNRKFLKITLFALVIITLTFSQAVFLLSARAQMTALPQDKESETKTEQESYEEKILFKNPLNGSSAAGRIVLRAGATKGITLVKFNALKEGLEKSLGAGSYNSAGDTWEFGLDTAKMENGDYDLKAIGSDGLGNYYYDKIFISINNRQSESQSPQVIFNLVAPKEPIVSGKVDLRVKLSLPGDNVVFKVIQPLELTFTGNKLDLGTTWGFVWDTAKYQDGDYKIVAQAAIGNLTYLSQEFNLRVDNFALIRESLPASIAFTFVDPKFTQVSQKVCFKVKTDTPVDNLVIKIINAKESTYQTTWNKQLSAWEACWETLTGPNGDYQVIARAGLNNRTYASQALRLIVSNKPQPKSVGPSPIYYKIIIKSPIEAEIVSKKVDLKAEVNEPLDKLDFYLDSDKTSEIDLKIKAASKDNLIWQAAELDISYLADGSYALYARGYKGDKVYPSEQVFRLEVKNEVREIKKEEVEITAREELEEMIKEVKKPQEQIAPKDMIWIITPTYDAVLSDKYRLKAGAEFAITAVELYYFQGGLKNLIAYLPEKVFGEWQYEWDTRLLANGVYYIQAVGKDNFGNKHYSGQIKALIKNESKEAGPSGGETKGEVSRVVAKEKPQVALVEPLEIEELQSGYREAGEYFSPICIEAGALTKEECDKIMSERSLLDPECGIQGITGKQDCEAYLLIQTLPQECQSAGIKIKEKCDYFIREKYSQIGYESVKGYIVGTEVEYQYIGEELPAVCKKAKVVTKKECDAILEALSLEKECRSKGLTTRSDCDEYLQKEQLPKECQEKGIFSEQECERFVFSLYAPKECREAGILDKESCEKYIFEKHLPAECREAKALTKTACEKYLFEQYKKPAQKQLSFDCVEAGIMSFDECKAFMRQKFFPQECRRAGITDEAMCESFLAKKFLPKECLDADLVAREACDRMLREKYLNDKCKAAGITGSEACEDFLFKKYTPRVECQGLDRWHCEEVLRKRYLGEIVEKKEKQKKTEEALEGYVGQAVVLQPKEPGVALSPFEEVIPLEIKEETTVLVLPSVSETVLSEDEEIIVTPSAILVFDADADGLPDDIEARLGTDANNPDSDGDGYEDGLEVKHNYNPLGPGRLQKEVAPVEKAIASKAVLEQPKTAGHESGELKIKKIENLATIEGAVQGMKLSGQGTPGQIIALYIYSDLAIVVTTQVDENSNWSYTLKQPLVDGYHEVYVSLNDDTGKIVAKSSPISFFIKEAKAISPGDFLKTEVRSADKTKISILYYVVGAFVLIIIGSILFILFIKQKKKEEPSSGSGTSSGSSV